jgi:small subunit ribosomal protein S4
MRYLIHSLFKTVVSCYLGETMSRYTSPKNRIARRFGINIFGRSRNPLVHKPNPAGMHGAKRKKKSDYGVQLEEKQKLKAAFGMLTETQLSRYFKKAQDFHKNTAEIFLQILDLRLDNVVYKLKFGHTPFQAQQLVAHGHVYVNGKKVDRRSFQVKPGMVISIKPSSRKLKTIAESLQSQSRAVPAYFELDAANFSGKLLALPSIDEISLPLEINVLMVCDFLAHKG